MRIDIAFDYHDEIDKLDIVVKYTQKRTLYYHSNILEGSTFGSKGKGLRVTLYNKLKHDQKYCLEHYPDEDIVTRLEFQYIGIKSVKSLFESNFDIFKRCKVGSLNVNDSLTKKEKWLSKQEKYDLEIYHKNRSFYAKYHTKKEIQRMSRIYNKLFNGYATEKFKVALESCLSDLKEGLANYVL